MLSNGLMTTGFLWFGLYQVAVTSTPETHPLISQKGIDLPGHISLSSLIVSLLELHFIQRNRAKLDEKVSPSQVPWKELFSSTAVWYQSFNLCFAKFLSYSFKQGHHCCTLLLQFWMVSCTELATFIL